MEILYIDCSCGISGHKLVGALLDLIDDADYLLAELKKLNLDDCFLRVERKTKQGISANVVEISLDEDGGQLYQYDTIIKLLDHSDFNDTIKKLAIQIFNRMAKAKSQLSDVAVKQLEFKKNNILESLILIVAVAILIDKINPDKIISSVVNDGCGFENTGKSFLPIPLPLTTQIFADSSVILQQIAVKGKLVTPTGAAIISELTDCFQPMPAMKINQTGWGFGNQTVKILDMVKVSLGSVVQNNDEIIVLETNIDDTTSEVLGYTSQLLFEHGALDVFFTPIYMKKNRPAYRLSVACKEEKLETMQNIIFKETTTIGMRYRREQRKILSRKQVFIDSPYGKVMAKEVIFDGQKFVYPEFEDVKRVAQATGLAFKDIYRSLVK